MALADVLQAAVVRPVRAGWLDFASDPLYGWTGSGSFAPSGTSDSDLNGNVFLEVEGAVEISEIQQDRGLGGPITITFAAAEMGSEPVVQQIIADRRAFLGRRAKIWQLFLSSDESSVLPEFYVLFNGVMVNAETIRQPGEPALIRVTCDQDLQKAQTAPVRWIDHSIWFPSDTASTFINSLARGPVATGVTGMPPGVTPNLDWGANGPGVW